MADPIRCSFCGATQPEVAWLVCAATVAICDECIDEAANKVREARGRQNALAVLAAEAEYLSWGLADA
jgi:ATP-dependent protease Clp ATPase subunit